jgi:hypothetical protein
VSSGIILLISTVKFIEQQLVAALTETPHETECSLSVAILRGIGLEGTAIQAAWLERHRPAKEGKSWQCIGDGWEYSATPVPHVTSIGPISIPAGSNWRTSQAASERLLPPIIVKPLPPLAGGR